MMASDSKRIVIIGLGGVGGLLLTFLWKMCSKDHTLYLVDGDKFEFANLERQYFTKLGNKARVWADYLAKQPSMRCKVVPVESFYPCRGFKVANGDIVFVAVDSFYARKVINAELSKLKNITVISGGNELTDGNVQFFVKKNGKLIMGDYLDTYHPEIATAQKPAPKRGCDRSRDPQLLITNANVALLQLNIFHSLTAGKKLDYSEVYFDIEQNKVATRERK